jgi:hypothetical protein
MDGSTREPANFRRCLAGLVFVIPIILMLLQFAWHGILYTFNENEVWFASTQGLNLLTHPANQAYLLTEQANEVRLPKVYTHNPWMLPRLACAALHACGLSNVLFQNLIICLLLYGAYVVCVARLLRPVAAVTVLFLLLLHLDYLGFFRSAFNLGRAWHFPLFFGCMVAICRPGRYPRLLPFLAFFLLWQFEIVFAVFTTAAAFLLFLLQVAQDPDVRQRWRATVMGAALGSGVSIGLFLCQLLCWYGIDGLRHDLVSTLHDRNTWGLERAPWRFVDLISFYDRRFRVWSMPANSWEMMRHGAALIVAQYGVLATSVCTLGIVYGAALILCPWQIQIGRSAVLGRLFVGQEPEARLLASLLWVCLPAYLVAAVVLRGETYMIDLFHYHPMLVFPISFAAALGTLFVCETLALMVERLWNARAQVLAWGLVPAVVLGTWLTASWGLFEMYRQLDGSLFWVLMEPQFHAKKISMTDNNEYLALLIRSLTGGPCVVRDPACIAQCADITEPEYLLHIEHWAWQADLSRTFRTSMDSLGHKIVAQGRHFVIVELAPPAPPSAGAEAKEGACDRPSP